MTSAPAAILVDLDNTLHDYNAAGKAARHRLIERIAAMTGLPDGTIRAAYEAEVAQEDDIAATGAEARRRRFLRLGQRLQLSLPAEELVTVLDDALIDAITPFPGALAALEVLTARHRVIILTEGYLDIQQAILEKLGLPPPQWQVFVTYAHGVRKRDGTAYAKVMRDYGLRAADTVMVGDNWDWDIVAAARQGMAQIWIAQGRALPGPPPPRFLGAVQDFQSVPSFLEGAALPRDVVPAGDAGRVRAAIASLNIDGFGNPRSTKRLFITVDPSEDSPPPAPDAQTVSRISGAPEVYLRGVLPRGSAESVARAFGRNLDEHWPLFRGAAACQPVASWRLGPPQAGMDTPPPGYSAALAATDPSPGLAAAIAALQAQVIRHAEAAAGEGDFEGKYGVLRVMNVGSTSRSTWTGPLVDFDAVIETSAPQATFDHDLLGRTAGRIADAVARDSAFTAYFASLGLPQPQLALASLGPRGLQSFVARYEITMAGRRHHFLDLTFGRLPQLTGYEIWLQRFFAGLAGEDRLRLQREIRLAKKAIAGMDGLYGSAAHGFRAHVIEQWVIQSSQYRATGLGSFDNGLRLLAEEAATIEKDALKLRLSLAEYKRRFPVWHPGWWEPQTGFGPDRPGVNLLDMLGDGNPAEAETGKWPSFAALGAAHASLIAQGGWSFDSLVAAARALARRQA